MSMRTLVIGDIHGSLESLVGVLDLVSYDPKKDRLICLGDYVDGWDESYEVVDYLISNQKASPYENIYLLGNHDKYFIDVLDDGIEALRDIERTKTINAEWWEQDGASTYNSYITQSDEDILRHKEQFFDKLRYYYEEDNYLFVHAGFNPRLGLKATHRIDPNELLWNRTLYQCATHNSNSSKAVKYDHYDLIYIGHTPTPIIGIKEPVADCNVLNLDQGCKSTKRLSCWVLETGEWFQYNPPE